MKKYEDSMCCNCYDLVAGLHKTKGAEFYRINSKIYCSLNCYHEEKEKIKDEITEEDIKLLNKISAQRSRKKKSKRKKR